MNYFEFSKTSILLGFLLFFPGKLQTIFRPKIKYTLIFLPIQKGVLLMIKKHQKTLKSLGFLKKNEK
jgi:hypothetical protein